jgi:hypothetical protein
VASLRANRRLIAGLIAASLVSAALMLSLGDYPVFKPALAQP